MSSSNKKSTASSFLERNTNPKNYTGSHQHRFDADTGKGLGLAGRDRVAKGSGTTSTPYTGGAIKDLSQITRTFLREPETTETAPQTNTKAPTKRCATKDCQNKSSPTSKSGFCSYHQHTKQETGNYPSEKSKQPPTQQTHRRIPTGEL
ncbi:p25-alpha [Plasmodiophora brassicae]|uniref:Uncharacterized protein n=1 Tax=Plasmodiophora brassicae TaxID=37360 RepID=A0A0G4IZK1_PLABS|nr:hypothetical protein PBRA_008090 [Plasmodiophora brassicae]SPQ99385.1 unnamed protein product [Plasmodiophora brassicae]